MARAEVVQTLLKLLFNRYTEFKINCMWKEFLNFCRHLYPGSFA